MTLQMRAGHLSDLVQATHREDWSAMNVQLKAIQPGEVLAITCPNHLTVSAFRSRILTNGRRFHLNTNWTLATRTSGRTISCFLRPV